MHMLNLHTQCVCMAMLQDPLQVVQCPQNQMTGVKTMSESPCVYVCVRYAWNLQSVLLPGCARTLHRIATADKSPGPQAKTISDLAMPQTREEAKHSCNSLCISHGEMACSKKSGVSFPLPLNPLARSWPVPASLECSGSCGDREKDSASSEENGCETQNDSSCTRTNDAIVLGFWDGFSKRDASSSWAEYGASSAKKDKTGRRSRQGNAQQLVMVREGGEDRLVAVLIIAIVNQLPLLSSFGFLSMY